ncbi:MFS transporter [Actinoplanes sp. NPDC049548]|uniref:MFS transporter n=1 Tax=Actinoplanes sp. NPDC049548 TaxID=3155152 RepID=UPI003427503A
MYLSTVSHPAVGRRGFALVSGNVLALGTVSLVTDVSAEMVTAVLPLYLVLGLQVSPLGYGVVDGLYTGATAVLRLAGGYLADRVGRPRTVAGFGYALSAVAKLGMLAAGASVAAVGSVIAVDRLGKGVRTAPRDALITASVPPEALGRAFGVHRAMDSAGAFLGPLVALAVLGATASSYDSVFVTSFCIAAMGVVVLVLFVRDRPVRAPAALRGARDLLRDGRVRRLVAAACLLGLVTVGDGFVYLLLQRREDLSPLWFPLLAVGTSLAYLLLAAPLGALADRIGRLPVVVGGHVALAATYLLVGGPSGGLPLIVAALVCYGAFYAATDGVLIALAGPVLPPDWRTTGIALIQTGQALAYLVSSVLFGLAWQAWGPATAIRVAAVAVAAALCGGVLLLRGRTA